MDFKPLKICLKASSVRKNPCLNSARDKLYADREKSGDIKFMVDGEVIHAHRCVLAALSPRYEAQFYGGWAEKGTITIEDVSPSAFKEFLQFFYTDEVTLTMDNIEGVLNLAKQSLVDELVTECTNFLTDFVRLDEIVWCYRLALDYDVKPLEEFCVKHISGNIKNVFQLDDFLSCEHDILCHILALPRLDCRETDVFDACIAWARAKCEQEGIDASGSIYDMDLRMALGEAITNIRFSSMALNEFTAIDKKYPDFFAAEESNEIFHEIGMKATADNYNLIARFNANLKYKELMTKTLEEERSYFTDDEFQKIHRQHKSSCIDQFNSEVKLGGNMTVDKYLQELENGIDSELKIQSVLNEQKHQKYIKAQKVKISKEKDEAISTYKRLFQNELTTDATSYLSKNSMVTNHARIKKQATELFNLNLCKENIEISKENAEELEFQFAQAYLPFKLKNSERESACLKAQKVKISKTKDEAISTYKRLFQNELTTDATSYLSKNSMVTNHARIKKQATELFNSKLSRENIEISKEIAKELDAQLEHAYLPFKLKNSERESACLKKQQDEKERLAKQRKELAMLNEQFHRGSSPFNDSGYSSRSSYSATEQSFNLEYSSTLITRRISTSSCSSRSPLPRAVWTSSENAFVTKVFLQTGRDWYRATQIFNDSSACQTFKSESQIRNKFYTLGMQHRL